MEEGAINVPLKICQHQLPTLLSLSFIWNCAKARWRTDENPIHTFEIELCIPNAKNTSISIVLGTMNSWIFFIEDNHPMDVFGIPNSISENVDWIAVLRDWLHLPVAVNS